MNLLQAAEVDPILTVTVDPAGASVGTQREQWSHKSFVSPTLFICCCLSWTEIRICHCVYANHSRCYQAKGVDGCGKHRTVMLYFLFRENMGIDYLKKI